MSFVPCSSCDRHVKSGDAACPFCGAATPIPAARIPGTSSVRLSRAALFAATASAALVAAACSSGSSGSVQALYGGVVIPDGGSDADAALDATAVALYGGPPVNLDAASLGDGTSIALYGGPPVEVDAGDAG